MKKSKKILALVLSVIMIVNLFAVISMLSGTAETVTEATVAGDNFDKGLSANWLNQNLGRVVGGKYHTERFLLNRYMNIPNETDYFVEADVKYSQYFDGENYHTGFTGIGVRYDVFKESGYELSIGAAAGRTSLALRLSKVTDGEREVLKLIENVGNVSDTLTVRLAAYENNIFAYIDGELLIECTDNTYASGVPVISTGDAFGMYDNFVYNMYAGSGFDNIYELPTSGDLEHMYTGSDKWENYSIQATLKAAPKSAGSSYGDIVVEDDDWGTAEDVSGSGSLTAKASMIVGNLKFSFIVESNVLGFDTTKKAVLYSDNTELKTEAVSSGAASINVKAVVGNGQVLVYLNDDLFYTYTDPVSGQVGFTAENSDGSISNISVSKSAINKSLLVKKYVFVETGTPIENIDFDLKIVSIDNTVSPAIPEKIEGYSSEAGIYTVTLHCDNLIARSKVYVLDDLSEIYFDDFSANDLSRWSNTSSTISGGEFLPASEYIALNNASWSDLYIEADVKIASNYSSQKATPAVGLVARNGSGNRIDYDLIKSGSKVAIRLFFRGSSVDASEYITDAIYNFDTYYKLRLEVFSKYVKAYVDGTLLFEAIIPEAIPANGTAGIANLNFDSGCSVDNFKVAKIVPESITVDNQAVRNKEGTAVVGVKVGFAEAADFTVSSDDIGATVSGCNLAQMGEQAISVTYGGFIANQTVSVVETAKSANLNDFLSALDNIALVSVKSTSTATINSLISDYDLLTKEQKNSLPSATIYKYQNAVRLYYKRTYSLPTGDIIFWDDCDDLSKWQVNHTDPQYWVSENGIARFLQNPEKEQSSSTIAYTAQNYGKSEFVSADMAGYEDAGYVGYTACYSDNGNYHIRGYFNEGKLSQITVCTSTNKGGDYTIIAYYNYSGTPILPGTMFRLSSTFSGNNIKVYLNGAKVIDTSKGTASVSSASRAITGVRILYTAADFDNFVVLGAVAKDDASSTAEMYKEETGTYVANATLADDFSTLDTLGEPSYWLEANNENKWTVNKNDVKEIVKYTEDFSSDASSLQSKGWNASVVVESGHLKASDAYPRLTSSTYTGMTDYRVEADVVLTDIQTADQSLAVASLCTRIDGANGYEFGICYNKTSGQSRIRLYDRAASKAVVDKEYPISFNTTYKMRVDAIGNNLYCYIDGVLVTSVTVTRTSGTVGFRGSCNIFYVDNLVITDLSQKQYGNPVYHLATSDYTKSWIHTFEPNPMISTYVKVSRAGANAQIGILSRYAVEDSFLKAGYDFKTKKWFISYTPGIDFATETIYSDDTNNFKYDTTYKFDLICAGSDIYFYVNNQLAVYADVYYVGFGRVGLFGDDITADFDNYSCYNASGASFDSGIVEMEINNRGNYLEIEEPAENTVILFAGTASSSPKAISTDGGRNFTLDSVGSYKFCNVAGAASYLSTIKMANGKYLSVGRSSTDFSYSAYVSDDFKTWTEKAAIVPENEVFDGLGTSNNGRGNQVALIHTNSFMQIEIAKDTYRIFLPVGFRVWKSNGKGGYTNTGNHYTKVYYSDDFGETWQVSSTTSSDVYGDGWEQVSFCESKVIRCSDGKLRIYCTRKWAPCVYYLESDDNGVTWSRWGKIESMPCAVSSFGISEDPMAPGTYYMAYVKNVPYSEFSITPRSHLMLAKTTDGKNWTEVMTVDRFTGQSNSGTNDIFQFLDPTVYVNEDYIFVTYGRSNRFDNGSPHNWQTARYTRIPRKFNVTIDSKITGGTVTANAVMSSAGEFVDVTVEPDDGYMLAAGSLKYYYDDGSVQRIITQPPTTKKGSGDGNVFRLTMPASDITITAEFVNKSSTDFSMATIAAAIRYDENADVNGIRFLTRLYLPTTEKKEVSKEIKYNGKDYTIAEFGSLIVPTSVLGQKELDMDAVTDQSVHAIKAAAYPNGMLYDLNSNYVDYTVVMNLTPDLLDREYVVRAYVKLDDGKGGIEYFYSNYEYRSANALLAQ